MIDKTDNLVARIVYWMLIAMLIFVPPILVVVVLLGR
jgi:hypothetical protein